MRSLNNLAVRSLGTGRWWGSFNRLIRVLFSLLFISIIAIGLLSNSLTLHEKYLPTLTCEGIPYTITPHVQKPTQLDLVVNEISSSDSDIKITIHYILLVPFEGRLWVYENLVYQNVGEIGLVNSTLQLSVPRDRYNFTSSMMDCCVIQLEDSITFDLESLDPEEQFRMWVEYNVPVDGSKGIFFKKIDHYTELVHVLVQKKPGIEVKSEGLKDSGETMLDDEVYQALLGSKLEVDSKIDISISGLPTSKLPINYVLLVSGFIAASVVTVAYLNLRRSRSSPEVTARLQRKIGASKATIKRLEADHNLGDVSQKVYKELKRKYNNRKTEAQKKLKELESKVENE